MAVLSPGRYVLASIVVAAAVVWHAFSTRQQFFPSMVYLSSSKFSLAVLGNLGFAMALATYKVVLRIFLGRLRDSEVERVNDKVGQAVVETCLAMTIFREDFTAAFLSMFIILSFVKIFHWLVQDRVDFIETTPNVTRLQHIRIVAFTLVLLGIDIWFLHYSIGRTMERVRANRPVGVDLLFAFEYTVQASTIVLTFIKYCLSMVDIAMEGRWEGKGVAVFYLELTLDMLHLLVYCAFFAVVFSTYGIPLHLVRDLYWTFRNFNQRVRDFLRYRRITANMDQSFPDATEEDLQRADHVCIICREELTTQGRNKKLGCNHVFHLHCLRSWLERQQNCPICRRSVVPPTPAAAAHAHAHAHAPRAAGAAVPPGDAPAAAGAAAPGAPGAAAGAALPGGLPAFQPAAAAAQPAAGAAAGAGLPAAGWPDVAHGGAGAAVPPLRRRRGWRLIGGAGAGEAAAQGMAVDAAGWHMVAHYPQWVPAAPVPMAMFVPAGGLPQIQYAGQQTPEQVLAAQQQAAAAAAAAAVSSISLMVPLAGAPAAGAAGEGSAPAPPTPQQHLAAVAATAAAAASLLAPAGSGPPHPPADPATAAATAAAAAAMEKVLQQQLASLRAHQQVARQVQQQAAAAAEASAAGGSSAAAASAPAAPAVVAGAAQPPAHAPLAPAAEAPAAQPAPAAQAVAQQQPQPEQRAQHEQPAPAQQAQQEPAQQAAPAGEANDADAVRRRRLERFGGGGA